MTKHVNPEDEVKKAVALSMKSPSEDIARSIMIQAGLNPAVVADLAKGTITTQTGLIAYDLQAPAKNLYPVTTPIRNRLPRVGGGVGTGSNWMQVSGITGSGFDSTPWVPEGQRAAQMSMTAVAKNSTYVTIGEEAGVTFEAINAGRTFEDVQASRTFRLLQKMMLKEESALIGGNRSIALGTPATPTLSAAGAGATLPAATYSVIVIALTYEGFRNSSLAVSVGVSTVKTVTGGDGKTYVLNGGASIKSAAASQIITLGQTLSASVTAIQGAVAYAWFVGTAGAETLQAITGLNSAKFSAPLNGATQTAASIASVDYSRNQTLAFDGLLNVAYGTGSGSYLKNFATGVAGTGTFLTSSGRGSCIEVDDMLQSMWDNWQVSPNVLYVNSQELRNMTTKCLSAASGPLLQYFQSPDQAYGVTASGTISFYYNPFMLDGGQRMPVRIHPNLPPGTILAMADNLPIQYQQDNIPNIAQVHTRQDYYQIDWPITTRERVSGVYAEEVLEVYAPFGLGVINNVGNG